MNKDCLHITVYEMRSQALDAIWDFCKECHVILNERKLSQQEASKDTISFGMYRGKTFAEIAKHDSSYLKWLLRQSFCKPWMMDQIRNVLA